MVWEITLITFLASLAAVGALVFAFLPNEIRVGSRLSQLLDNTPKAPQASFADRQKGKARDTLASIGQMLPASGSQSKGQLLMLRAGYRSANAIVAMRGAKLLVPAA